MGIELRRQCARGGNEGAGPAAIVELISSMLDCCPVIRPLLDTVTVVQISRVTWISSELGMLRMGGCNEVVKRRRRSQLAQAIEAAASSFEDRSYCQLFLVTDEMSMRQLHVTK